LSHPTISAGSWIVAGVVVLTAAWCSAQDNGLGQTPMAPPAPSQGENPNSGGPHAPVQPGSPARGPSWPGGEASPWAPPDGRSTPQQAPAEPGVETRPCEGTVILARIGNLVVLDGELLGAADEIIKQNLDKMPLEQRQSIPPNELEAQRVLILQQLLRRRIETLLIFLDAKRGIPTERWPDVESQIAKYFEDEEVDRLMKRVGTGTRRELEQKLRAVGTSIERERRGFIENTLAQQWAHQQIQRNEEITYDQMKTYYSGHREEFAKPARASWEELMVRTANYPSRQDAYAAVARMGNQVLAGAPLAEVARAGSDGTTASDGGRRPWTTKDSLAIAEINRALFSQPIGKLGPIIQSDVGYHILRVTAREEAAVTPFLDAQTEIRQKIAEQRTEKQYRDYMTRLTTRTPIWTIFDKANGETLMSRRPGSMR
jgi:hypothetical protein